MIQYFKISYYIKINIIKMHRWHTDAFKKISGTKKKNFFFCRVCVSLRGCDQIVSAFYVSVLQLAGFECLLM